jgi:hypothetical protein
MRRRYIRPLRENNFEKRKSKVEPRSRSKTTEINPNHATHLCQPIRATATRITVALIVHESQNGTSNDKEVASGPSSSLHAYTEIDDEFKPVEARANATRVE